MLNFYLLCFFSFSAPKKKNNKDSVSQANLKKANKAKGKTIVKPILSTQKTTETIG